MRRRHALDLRGHPSSWRISRRTAEGYPTHQQWPNTAFDSRTAHQDLLHRVENYKHQRYLSVQQMADETLLLLRSLSQRLRRFQARTGGFVKAQCPRHGTDWETTDHHCALILPVSSAETGFAHATNGNSSPTRRSTPNAGDRNHIGLPTRTSNMTGVPYIPMKYRTYYYNMVTQQDTYSEPKRDGHTRENPLPPPSGDNRPNTY